MIRRVRTPWKLQEITRFINWQKSCGDVGKYSTIAFSIAGQRIEWWTRKRVVKVLVPRVREAFSRHPRPDRLWSHLPSYELDSGALSWGLKVTGTWNWPFTYRLAVFENTYSFSSSVLLLLNDVPLKCSHYYDTLKSAIVCKQYFYWKQFLLFSCFIKPQMSTSETCTGPLSLV